MYGVAGRSWIAMGDPVGDREAGRDLIWRFAERVDRAGARPVFYAVDGAWLSTYLDLGLSILKVGEVARVDLTQFSLSSPHWAELRRADRRASKEGITFAIVAKADVPALLPELRAVSDAWLAGKAGHEKGFSLGFFDEAYLEQFDLAVMRKDGVAVAFANLWRGADQFEMSPDLMRYRPNVSKVMMDALFARLMAQAADEGYRWFNLGATPLAGLSSHPLASTWNRFGTFIYRYAEGVYNFEGLRAYKQKFLPTWTPQYLACPGGLEHAVGALRPCRADVGRAAAHPPLDRRIDRHDIDLLAGLLRAGGSEDARDRRDILIVAADRGNDVALAGKGPIGRVVADPAGLAAAPGAHPGMHGVGALPAARCPAAGWCAGSR